MQTHHECHNLADILSHHINPPFNVVLPYLSLEFSLAVGVYFANQANYLPFDSSISGLDHHISHPVESYRYNVAHYGYLAKTWYALYQCDSLGIQCDLLFETSGEENSEGRFQLDNLSLEYETSSNIISLLYGTEIMFSHSVPSHK